MEINHLSDIHLVVIPIKPSNLNFQTNYYSRTETTTTYGALNVYMQDFNSQISTMMSVPTLHKYGKK